MERFLRALLAIAFTALYTADCMGQDGTMFITDMKDRSVFRIDLANVTNPKRLTKYYSTRYQPTNPVYDDKNKKVYWVDNKNMKIRRMGTNGSYTTQVYNFDFMNRVGAMAIDSNAELLFFTDTLKSKIGVLGVKDDSTYYSFIKDEGLSKPLAIATDPENRKLYYIDVGNNTLEKANYDGTEVTVVLQGGFNNTQAMTYDQIGKVLYWCDSGRHIIESYDMKTMKRSTVIDYASMNKTIKDCKGIVVDASYIYYVSKESNYVMFLEKANTSNTGKLENSTYFRQLGGLALYKPGLLYKGPTQCDNNNGGCAYICLPVGQTDVTCHCTHGKLLLANQKNCTKDRYNHGSSLLYTNYIKNSNYARLSGIDNHPDQWFDAPYIPKPWYLYAKDMDLYAIDIFYEKKRLVANDLKSKSIVTIMMDGTLEIKTVYAGTSNEVHGLAVDWVHGNVYWTDVAYNWIMMAKVEEQTKNYKVIVQDNLEKPFGIVVDPDAGYIFWADNIDDGDAVKTRKIERANLDGSNRQAIISRGLVKPQSMTIDYEGKRIYFTDSSRVKSCNYTGGDIKTIVSLNSLGTHFTGLSYYKGYMFIADFRSSTFFSPRIIFWRIRDRNGFYMTTYYKTHGVTYYDKDKQPSYSNVCENNMCVYWCTKGANGQAKCICPDGYVLQKDGKNCILVSDVKDPKYCIVYGDQVFLMSTKNSKNTNGVTVKSNGRNWTKIDVNYAEETLFMVDSKNNAIDTVRLNNLNKIHTVLFGLNDVTDLSIDWIGNRIYWLDGTYGIMWMSKLDGTHQTQVMTGLKWPSSLAVDAFNRKVYYSVRGKRSGIYYANLDGSNSTMFQAYNNEMYSLSIDYLDRRLYFIDRKLGYIRYKHTDTARKKAYRMSYKPIAVTTFQDFATFVALSKTRGGPAVVVKADLEGESLQPSRSPINMTNVYDIVSYASVNQPQRSDPCGDDNGGCEQLCYSTNASVVGCSCSQGLRVINETKCAPAKIFKEEFWLLGDSIRRKVFQFSEDMKDFSAIKIPQTESPNVVTFDQVNGIVFWSDGTSIKSMDVKTEEIKTLMFDAGANFSCLEHDPNSRLLYYTDFKQNKIGLISSDSGLKKTLPISGIVRPISLVLKIKRGLMFVASLGPNNLQGKISRIGMDGSYPTDLITNITLGPMTMDSTTTSSKRRRRGVPGSSFGYLYWVDNFQHKINKMRLSDPREPRALVKQLNASVKVTGLTVNKGYLYVTDANARGIMKINTATGDAETLRKDVLSAVDDLKFVPKKPTGIVNNCTKHNGGCSHMCIPTTQPSIPEGYVCGCADGTQLGSNKRDCMGTTTCVHKIPNGFLDDGCSRKPRATCSFTCNPETTKSTTSSIYCKPSGIWEPSLSTLCIPWCPLIPSTGYIKSTNSCLRKVGSTCTFKCRTTRMYGDESRTCQFRDGVSVWSGNPLVCTVPPTTTPTVPPTTTPTPTIPPSNLEGTMFVTDMKARSVFRIDLANVTNPKRLKKYYSVRYQPTNPVYDDKNNKIYWVDNKNMKIRRMSANGTYTTQVYSFDFMNRVGALAIDSNAELLFFTDTLKSKIGVLGVKNYYSTYYSFVKDEGLSKPLAIATDPENRKLYYIDVGNNTLEKANYDGTEVTVVLQGGFNNTQAMTYDQIGKVLYWCDSGRHIIESYDMKTMKRSTVIDYASMNKTIKDCKGIAVDASYIYYVSKESRHVMFLEKANTLNTGLLDDSTVFGQLGGLALYKAGLLYKGPTQCDNNNGGCAYICLPVGQTDVTCHCSHGKLLLADQKNCTKDRYNHGSSLLYTNYIKNSNYARLSGIDNHPDQWFDAPYIPKPWYMYAKNMDLYAIDIYYEEKILVANDLKSKSIVTIKMDGTLKIETIYAGTSNEVHGLAVDWVHGNVYWTDVAYNWIMMAKVEEQTKNYKVIVQDNLEKPFGIVVDPDAGYIFWADNIDDGDPVKTRKIERANLDGSNRQAIVSKQIYGPQSMTIDYDGKRIYYTDNARVKSCNYTGGDMKTMISLSPYGTHFTGLSYYKGYLFIADFRSSSYYKPRIIFWRIRDRYGFYMSTSHKTHGVTYYDKDKQPSYSNVCKNNMCVYWCTKGANGQAKCICPDGYVLQKDGKNCTLVTDVKEPKYCIVYGDQVFLMSTKNTKNTNGVTMKSNGRNWTNIDVNYAEETLFMVDSKNNAIDTVRLNNLNKIHTVLFGLNNVTDLSIDWIGNRIYWLDGTYGIMWMSKLDGTYQTQVMTGLKSPSSLAVDAFNRKVYYSVRGERPGIYTVNLDGSNSTLFQTYSNEMHSLSLDYLDRRLYYIDRKYGYIRYKHTDTTRKKAFRTSYKPIAVTTFQDFATIIAPSKTRGGPAVVVKADLEGKSLIPSRSPVNATTVYDIVSYASVNQPRRSDPCDDDNGGCEQLCYSTNASVVGCSCSQGLRVVNETKCMPAQIFKEEFLLLGDSIRRKVFQFGEDMKDLSAVKIPQTESPNVVTFDQVNGKMFWSDGTSIKSMNVVTEEMKTLKFDAGAKFSSLEHDANSRLLYFTDFNRNKIGMISSASGLEKTLPVTGIIRPISLLLNPKKGIMYVASLGPTTNPNGKISRIGMDGSNPSDLVINITPGPMAMDSTMTSSKRRRRDSPPISRDNLYWVDNGQHRIQKMSLSDTTQQKVLVTQLNNSVKVTGLTVNKGYLYMTDANARGIMKINTDTGRSKTLRKDVLSAVDNIKFVPKKPTGIVNNCTVHNGGCSHMCIPTNSPSIPEGYICACADGTQLGSNKRDCVGTTTCVHKIPNGFLDDGCSRKPRTTCSFTCNPETTSITTSSIYCKPSGIWEPSLSTLCIPWCRPIPSTDHVKKANNCFRKVGSTCILECEASKIKESGDESRTCEFKNGVSVWSGTPLVCGVPRGPRNLEGTMFVTDMKDRSVFRIDLPNVTNPNRLKKYFSSRYQPTNPVYDDKNNKIYWVDNKNMKIRRMSANGTYTTQVYSFDFMNRVGALAIDSNAELLFFTDTLKSKIGVLGVKDHNTYYSFIKDEGLSKPLAITTDPENRKIYYIDVGNNTLEKANYDGTAVTVVLRGGFNNTQAMTYDQIGKVLYWCDSGRHIIESYDMKTMKRSTVIDYASMNKTLQDCKGIAVDTSYIYYISKESNHIMFLEKANPLNTGQLDYNTRFGQLGGLAYYKAGLLYKGPTQCDNNNGGCSYICLPIGQTDVTCHCSDGKLLLADQKNCTRDRYNHGSSLLFTNYIKNSRYARLSGIDNHPDQWFDAPYIPRPWYMYAKNMDLYAIDIYYEKKMLVANDLKSKSILTITMDGTREIKTVFTGTSNEVHGLAVDWVHGNVYWTDVAYNWIMMAKVEELAKNYKVIVQDNLEKPFGIVVDPNAGYIFWTDNIDDEDTVKTRKIERSNLDGSNRQAIISSGLVKPQSMAIDYEGKRIYFTDSSLVKSCNYAGGDLKTIIKLGSFGTHFTGLSYYKGYVFIADFRSMSILSPRIIFWRMRDKNGFFMSTHYKAHGVTYYDKDKQPSYSNVCKNNMCVYWCTKGAYGQAKCICPDGYVLQKDGKNCTLITDVKEPKYCIVYADQVFLMTTKNTKNTNGVTVKSNGRNWTKIDVNYAEETLFMVDSKNNTIDTVRLNNLDKVHTVLFGLNNVTDLSIDWIGNRIYWLDGTYGIMWMSKLDGTHQTQVMTGLKWPSSLAVDAYNRSMYILISKDKTKYDILMYSNGVKCTEITLSVSMLYCKTFQGTQKVYYSVRGERPGIYFANLDGSNSTLFQGYNNEMHSLSLDYLDRRLYFIDRRLGYIRYRHTYSVTKKAFRTSYKPIAVTTFQDFATFVAPSKTPGGPAAVVKADLEGKSLQPSRSPINTTTVYDIVSYASVNQPHRSDPCDDDNGGCEQLCYSTNASVVECSCSQGLRVVNETKCVPANILKEEFLLLGDSIRRKVFQFGEDVKDVSAIKIPQTESPNVVTFDQVSGIVFWSDGTSIRSMNVETEEMKTLKFDAGAKFSSLEYEPNSKLLYFTDYKQSKIGVISLGSGVAKTLPVSGIIRPTSLLLNAKKGIMYVGSLGPTTFPHGKISHIGMDGSNPSDLVISIVPGPITMDSAMTSSQRGRRESPISSGDNLYWVDNAQRRIQKMSLSDTTEQKFLVKQLDDTVKVTGLTVNKDNLYMTDANARGIMKINTDTGRSESLRKDVLSAVDDIKFVPKKPKGIVNNCTVHNGGCSHMCIPTNSPSITEGYVCACADGTRLSSDKRNCVGTSTCVHTIPNGFLDDGCSRKPGSTCSFTCNPETTSSTNSIYCKPPAAIWEPSLSSLCMPWCQPIPSSDYVNKTNNCFRKVGSTCKYMCEAYKMKYSGDESRTCEFNDGVSAWSGTPLVCGVPTTLPPTTTPLTTTTRSTTRTTQSTTPVAIQPKSHEALNGGLGRGLSGGAIAGIIVALVLILLLVIAGIFIWRRFWPFYVSKRYEEQINPEAYGANESPAHLSFANPVYDSLRGAQGGQLNNNVLNLTPLGDAGPLPQKGNPEVNFGPDVTEEYAETVNLGSESPPPYKEKGGVESGLPQIESLGTEINTKLRDEEPAEGFEDSFA